MDTVDSAKNTARNPINATPESHLNPGDLAAAKHHRKLRLYGLRSVFDTIALACSVGMPHQFPKTGY